MCFASREFAIGERLAKAARAQLLLSGDGTQNPVNDCNGDLSTTTVGKYRERYTLPWTEGTLHESFWCVNNVDYFGFIRCTVVVLLAQYDRVVAGSATNGSPGCRVGGNEGWCIGL